MRLKPPSVDPGLGRMLRFLRENAGLTQSELAALTHRGITRTAIAQIERANVYPRAETLMDLANALGYEVSLHFRRKGTPKANGPPVGDLPTLTHRLVLQGVSNHGSNQGLEERYCAGEDPR